jgi:dihydrofolate synthase/folylpolyglutamate synthase
MRALARRPSGRIRPELDSLREVLAGRGSPQLTYPSILIVGTNGKGSTAAMLEAILRAHDLRTGLFTSPHLVRVEERVRLNGTPVAAEQLATAIQLFDDAPDLTYFETLAAGAFSIFADEKVEVAVLEAGMGGSWDATRLAASEIAGLTNIGSDHAGWLGTDPEAIARDKGQALASASRGVIGSGVDQTLVAALDSPNAERATSLAVCSNQGDGRVKASWGDREILLHLPLLGAHQLENLELALALAVEAAAAGLIEWLDPSLVRVAVEGVSWPGRLSRHRVTGREILLDCAHNLEATEVLAGFLAGQDRRYNLLFSCLEDKPVEAMARVLKPHVGEVIVCPLADARAMPVERLVAAFPTAAIAPSPLSALESLRDPVLAAGSIRLIGALYALAEEAP